MRILTFLLAIVLSPSLFAQETEFKPLKFEIGLVPRGSDKPIMFDSVEEYSEATRKLTLEDVAQFKQLCAQSIETCNQLWDEGAELYIKAMGSEAETYYRYHKLVNDYNQLVVGCNSLMGGYNELVNKWNRLVSDINAMSIPRRPSWWQSALAGFARGLSNYSRPLNCTAQSINIGFVTRTTLQCY